MPAIRIDQVPDLVALHAAAPQHFPCLFQSSGSKGWDILLAYPRDTLLSWDGDGHPVFADLQRRWQAEGGAEIEPGTEHLPFRGGWFVFLAYEALQEVEPSVATLKASSPFPRAALARVPAAICVDRANNVAWLFAEAGQAQLIDELRGACQAVTPFEPSPLALLSVDEEAPQQFLSGVQRIKQYIHEGDVFQVNLSREWRVELEPSSRPVDVFAALRAANPAPFSALARLSETHAIVSSSPERLLRVRGGMADTRPIAGTHPRSTDPDEDMALKARLIGSVKERAEHVMLIDLERNDLGRVCVPGSVEVDELMAVESYAFVHHIESNIKGRLRPEVSPAQAIAALFPGGTITGCPKVRTMQIISELESGPRQAYTGSLGYVNRDGDMDLNILIRSFMQTGDELRFRAGAGIVADSDPERELNETRAKARGLLRALGVAG